MVRKSINRREEGVLRIFSTLDDVAGVQAGLVDAFDKASGFANFRGIEVGAGLEINVIDADDDRFDTPQTKLVLTLTGGGGGGEINTASNLGAGDGLFAAKIGSDLQFKSLIAGSNINFTVTGNDITIDAVAGGSIVDEFIALIDTPAAYTGEAGSFVRVTTAEDGLEYVTLGAAAISNDYSDLTNLPFIPSNFSDLSGLIVETQLSTALQIKINDSRLDNLNDTADPTIFDDSGDGYSVGSIWINQTTGEAFRALDVTPGAAVWVQTTLTSDELATVALSGDYNDLINTPAFATVATTGDYNDLINLPALSTTFLGLTDTPSAYATFENRVVTVNPAGTGLIFSSNFVQGAVNLGTGTGVFASIAGSTLGFKSLVAGTGTNITSTATEIVITSTFAGSLSLNDLTDVDLTTSPTTGQILEFDGSNFVAVNNTGGAGVSDFLALTDTPNSYATRGLEVLQVNSAENGVTFIPLATVAFSNDYLDLDNLPTIPTLTTINQFGDVNTTGAVTGSLLVFNAGSGNWEVGVDKDIQNLWETFTADVGTTTANSATDTLTIVGGLNVSTNITGDTLTISSPFQSLWETVDADTGSTTANLATDTLTIAGGLNVTTSISGDVLTIDATAGAVAFINDIGDVNTVGVSDGDILVFNNTSGDWESVASGTILTGGDAFGVVVADTGTATASNPSDTLLIEGGTSIVTSIIGNTLTIDSAATVDITNITSLGDLTINTGGNVIINGVSHGPATTVPIADNTTGGAVTSFPSLGQEAYFLDYVLSRPGDGLRTGSLTVTSNGSVVQVSDVGVDNGNIGVTFNAALSVGVVNITYDSTSTGNAGTMSFTAKWFAL